MNRPQSLEDLIDNFFPGLVVFDAGDPLPEWLRTCMEMRSLSVNRVVVEHLLSSLNPKDSRINKMAYLVAKDGKCLTMAALYDDWGILYTIQL
jgi:hypothetical protein